MPDDSTTPPPLRTVRLDSRQIRVLAHPLRIRLVGLLRVDGPATATTLAARLDTNSGATSYHLRQLAEVGLVVEEPGRGTGRQRFWRAVHQLSSWDRSDFATDPDAGAAADWLTAEQVRLLTERAERWAAVQSDYSSDWHDAAGVSDALLTIGPARLQALTDELWEVIMRYRDESPADEPGAEPVSYFLASYPRAEDADRGAAERATDARDDG